MHAASDAAVGPSPFRARFGFVSGALAGCAIAAGVLALMLATTSGDSEDGLAPNWSEWEPSTVQPVYGAREIARHIQGTYRNEKRRQLASVSGGSIALGPVPLAVLMPNGDDVDIFEGTGVQYTLGGSGRDGALKDSKPSRARHRLLRREGLELALYSFRYLPDVTMVVALLPPAPKPEQIRPRSKKEAKPFQRQALFYRPGDLESQLEVPLHHTLTVRPPAIDRLNGEEAQRIDSLTLSNLFEYAYTQGRNGAAYLVLERPGR